VGNDAVHADIHGGDACGGTPRTTGWDRGTQRHLQSTGSDGWCWQSSDVSDQAFRCESRRQCFFAFHFSNRVQVVTTPNPGIGRCRNLHSCGERP
jgi:hypothetical protein